MQFTIIIKILIK